MPFDAASAPVLPAVPATQSQPPSDLTAQPAHPLRVQESTSGQPATTSTGAPLEARAQVGTPGGPPRGVEDAGTHGGPAIPTDLLEGAMQWGLTGFLDMGTKTALGPMSREFDQAIKTQETNPHIRAAFAANARLRENPTQQARDEAEAANARSKAFHRVVDHWSQSLHNSHAALHSAIEEANKSHSVPDEMHRMCAFVMQTLHESCQFDKAIEMCELGMTYADNAPTLDDYLLVALRLIDAGKFSLSVELIKRVTDPKMDFPVHDGPNSADWCAYTLATAKIHMGDYEGALRAIEAHPSGPKCIEIAAVANYKLAMLKPEGADRADLLEASGTALKADVRASNPVAIQQVALARLYFSMDRVEEAMHCVEEITREGRLGHAAVTILPRESSVRHSPQRAFILASPVWAEYARVMGVPNPAHELMDRESIKFSFDLPAIIAPPRHKILSVRDLEAQMTPSPVTRPRGESEAKR